MSGHRDTACVEMAVRDKDEDGSCGPSSSPASYIPKQDSPVTVVIHERDVTRKCEARQNTKVERLLPILISLNMFAAARRVAAPKSFARVRRRLCTLTQRQAEVRSLGVLVHP